jgi:hypothetical protein
MRPPSLRSLSPRARTALVVSAVALVATLLPATMQSASSAEPPLVRIARIADSSGFDWRSHGVSFHIGCSELQEHCPPGAYETASNRILIAEDSLRDDSYLHDLVLHELGHAWQFAVRGWPTAEHDMLPWGLTGVEALEAGADCLAVVLGAQRTHHWTCPPAAVAHLRALYERG